ncbi:MAG: hypothetical protein LC791_11325, partial [Acidobacteria bacterium]|nr:hypothetical protein [Acidobacteriota bacterium]
VGVALRAALHHGAGRDKAFRLSFPLLKTWRRAIVWLSWLRKAREGEEQGSSQEAVGPHKGLLNRVCRGWTTATGQRLTLVRGKAC